MSETFAWFRAAAGPVAVALPFDLEGVLADWASLRPRMTRTLPESFERDEWAYLISFLEPESLRGAFVRSFGQPIPDGDTDALARRLARPRGPVAVWLPNNVSLLGPLGLVLLSLTGNPLRLKGGSQSDDLTGAFLAFALEHLPEGALRRHLEHRVHFAVFDRDDARNAEWAAAARVRIVFGSDEAARGIEALPHPLDSVGFAFFDRRSEAWVSSARTDDALLRTLIRVFAIYGQAGCTAPRRVVLLDAAAAEVCRVRDRMLELWPSVVRGEPPAHIASSSVEARQWAAALGWDAALAPRHAAMLAAGGTGLEEFEAPMGLPLVAASLDEAVATLPANIQTIGHALPDPGDARWLSLVAASAAKRFVPLAQMHHFGPVWDGADFWRQCFEDVELSP